MADLTKKEVDTSKNSSVEMIIPKEAILKLKELQKYSKDMLAVLLPKDAYKPTEAINIVKAYFKE